MCVPLPVIYDAAGDRAKAGRAQDAEFVSVEFGSLGCGPVHFQDSHRGVLGRMCAAAGARWTGEWGASRGPLVPASEARLEARTKIIFTALRCGFPPCRLGLG